MDGRRTTGTGAAQGVNVEAKTRNAHAKVNGLDSTLLTNDRRFSPRDAVV